MRYTDLMTGTLGLLLLQADGCQNRKPEQATSQPCLNHYQRFVPVERAPDNMRVPWNGFFALDTQTGQLCLTTGAYIPEGFSKLPTCEEDLKLNPTQ
jgi:hypothetical protein